MCALSCRQLTHSAVNGQVDHQFYKCCRRLQLNLLIQIQVQNNILELFALKLQFEWLNLNLCISRQSQS